MPEQPAPTADARYWVPIVPADLLQIAERLRSTDVFTPTFVAPEIDRYNPAVYRHQASQHETSTRLLADRNLLSRWVGLVRGDKPQSAHRLAAGVLAFAQCADIDVEPNIALYEVAQRLGADEARAELFAFRVADETHPGYWAEVALGQANAVAIPESALVPASDATIDLGMALSRWRRHYVLCLKLAELELEGGSASERVSRLLQWMYDEFTLSGPAIVLAATYLAPNASRAGLLKQVRSPNRERAVDGVRNAAWDLTLVSEWLKAVDAQKYEARLTLLASLDQSVHSIARAVGNIHEASIESDSQLSRVLTALWGEHVGSSLAIEISRFYGLRESPHRRVNQAAEGDYVADCIDRGEAAVRAWHP